MRRVNLKLPHHASREEVTREFGRRLEERLKVHDMIQADLARAVGVSRDSANKWFHGHSLPRRPMLEKIAQVLECTAGDLVPSALSETNPNLPDFSLHFIGGGLCRVRIDRILPVGIGTKIAGMIAGLESSKAEGEESQGPVPNGSRHIDQVDDSSSIRPQQSLFETLPNNQIENN